MNKRLVDEPTNQKSVVGWGRVSSLPTTAMQAGLSSKIQPSSSENEGCCADSARNGRVLLETCYFHSIINEQPKSFIVH